MTEEVTEAKAAISSSLTPSESLASYPCTRRSSSLVSAVPSSVNDSITTRRSLDRRRLRIRPLPTILVTTTLMRDILTGSICASCVVVRSSSPRKTLRRANSRGMRSWGRHQFSHPLGHGVHEDGHTWPQIIGRSPRLTAL